MKMVMRKLHVQRTWHSRIQYGKQTEVGKNKNKKEEEINTVICVVEEKDNLAIIFAKI